MKKSRYLNIVADSNNPSVKTSRKTPLDSTDPMNAPNLYADGPVNISPSEIQPGVAVYFVDVATFSNNAQFVSAISETI